MNTLQPSVNICNYKINTKRSLTSSCWGICSPSQPNRKDFPPKNRKIVVNFSWGGQQQANSLPPVNLESPRVQSFCTSSSSSQSANTAPIRDLQSSSTNRKEFSAAEDIQYQLCKTRTLSPLAIPDSQESWEAFEAGCSGSFQVQKKGSNRKKLGSSLGNQRRKHTI